MVGAQILRLALPNTRDSVPNTTSARPCNYAHFVLEEQRQLVQEQGVIQPLRRNRWDWTHMHWMLGYQLCHAKLCEQLPPVVLCFDKKYSIVQYWHHIKHCFSCIGHQTPSERWLLCCQRTLSSLKTLCQNFGNSTEY